MTLDGRALPCHEFAAAGKNMRFALLLLGLVACSSTDPSWTPNGDGGPSTSKADASTSQPPQDDASVPTKPTNDAGAADAPAQDDADYNTPTTCTSGQFWTGGSTKSTNMEPGLACRSCHVVLGQASSKEFDVSGTVYPTAHEPDNCNGVGNVTVVITDANGADHSLSVNSVGNFYHDDGFGFLKIPTPYKAKIVSGNSVREMISTQTNGDCNSCHTEAGTQSAPGRIMAP